VYWRPVHAALEGAFTLIVGNASHMRNVPGRKTDVRDAEWIADLVRHGLVRASFVPSPEVRVLRDLVRHRKALVGTLAAERNRTIKLLESAGIKLAGVMSSVFGVSGMLMLRALAVGTAAPAAMADLAKRRLRSKLGRLTLALDGSLAEHQRLLLGMHIRRLEEIGRDVTEVEAAIAAAMHPFAAQQALLVTIPGVDALTAAAIIAEIGGGGHGRLRPRPAPGRLGRDLPGQPRERRQAEAARHPQGQSIPQGRLGHRRGVRRPDQGQLPA